jgi:heme-degrading monooxygenase HmoA
MLARIWRGWTKAVDADAYVDYVRKTGISAFQEIAGNRGAWILRRQEGDRTEFVVLSFWESVDAIREFAGDDIGEAVFYPEDDRFLVDRELRVLHYEVMDAD